MKKDSVTTELPTKKITLRVHPLTIGHLTSQAYLNASARKASVSAEVAAVLDRWADPDSVQAVGVVVPQVSTKVQVMGCVKPSTLAALSVEYAKKLKAWNGQGEEPSLSSVAGEVVDAWFFSDYRNLPFREGDKMRRKATR